MTAIRRSIAQCDTAESALDSLCQWFFEDRLSAEGCEPVLAANLPPAFRELLVHNEHMTRKLEAYHQSPMRLRVLHERMEDNIYSRNIELVTGDDHVVEFGIVRIDLKFTPEPVKSQILDKQNPLGDILISNEVLRRIEPRWYMKFSKDSPLADHFEHHEGEMLAGRVGIIYCENEPAIELLEVVTDVRRGGS